MGKPSHGAGSPKGKAAGDNRKITKAAVKAGRVEVRKPQMERKPFENGG
jgi:hypothetical protein